MLFVKTAGAQGGENIELNDTEKHLVAFLADYGNNRLPKPWVHPKKVPVESIEERIDRVKLIALATTLELRNSEKLNWIWDSEDLAISGFSKMWHESGRFSYDVHTGKKRGDKGKSVCLGQIMNGGEDLVGTDLESTRRCVAQVFKHISLHANRCLKYTPNTPPSVWAMAKAYAGYGTGHSCNADIFIFTNEEKTKKRYWARERANLWFEIRNEYYGEFDD